MRAIILCAVLLSGLSSAHAFTPAESRDKCQALAEHGVKAWPDFKSEELTLAAYGFHADDEELVCLFATESDKAAPAMSGNMYMFAVYKKLNFVFRVAPKDMTLVKLKPPLALP